MVALRRGRVCSSPLSSWTKRWAASGFPLDARASTMQPMVVLVGMTLRDRISFQAVQAPETSPRKPCARMRLPKVCAPITATVVAPPRMRLKARLSESARPARMHASHTELTSTSSIGSSRDSMSAKARSTSPGAEDCCTPFRRMEQVTPFGLRPQAFISSTKSHAGFVPVRIAASMNSLNVTQLGAKLPPAVLIVSMAARAARKSPRCKCFLIMVL
mmetsp:Transcript_36989/g.84045  ORF Transcript_36989/g.84045 Transcript_36989/m.84045 type:complete len:217 (-) Transcript_36989:548-1198(-)